MGTTCYLINTRQTTKAIIERDQTQQYIAGERHGFGFDYLTMKGATGYGIMHRQDKDTGEKKHFGIVFKTSRHKTKHWGMSEFCIKEITEDMGPVQTNAPARMLDLLDKLAPNPTGYAAQWRKDCRENIARSKAPKAKPKAGDRVIYGGTEYTLERPAGPRRGWQVKHPSGHTYRMNARQLSHAMSRPAPAPEPAPQKQVTPAEFFSANYGNKVLFVQVGDRAA
jgi:hypothetical protein